MKKALLAMGGVAILIGVATYLFPSKLEVTVPNNEVKEVVKEVTVPELDKRVKEAITASSTEIEQKTQEASRQKREQLESEIRLRVINQMKSELSKLEEVEEAKVGL